MGGLAEKIDTSANERSLCNWEQWRRVGRWLYVGMEIGDMSGFFASPCLLATE